LDLDALVLEPARILLPAGAIELRDFTSDEALAFARRVTQPPAGWTTEAQPLWIADCIAELAVAPETARQQLDQVTLLQVFELARWLQTMAPPTFTAPAPPALAEVTLHGRVRGLYPLRLATFGLALRLREAAEAAGDGGQEAGGRDQESVEVVRQLGAALLASALTDTTVAEILALGQRVRMALDALLQETMTEALRELQASPLSGVGSQGSGVRSQGAVSPTRSRKSRAATAGATAR
jgi:hypothetical protein